MDSSEKSMAKILGQGFVTIWEMPSKNQETPTKKRARESDPEPSDTGKVKQVKVESLEDVDSDPSVPPSPKGKIIEISGIHESIEIEKQQTRE
ncbi:hypothetical protein ACLOAV_004549 [Pseudogymnoascus australis]